MAVTSEKMGAFEGGFLLAVAVFCFVGFVVAAYQFGVEDGARQAAPLCVGEDTVRVHPVRYPTRRTPIGEAP